MKVIRHASELAQRGRSVSVAIGMFDGVHLGHQRILRQTVEHAQAGEAIPLAITFDQHPNVVVAPGRAPALIYSLAQRLRVISSFGIEATWLIHFDQAFSRQTGEEFVTRMVRDFGQLLCICIGSDFTFGYKRSGDVPLLRALGQKYGFVVHEVPAVLKSGLVVSSTRIREAIQNGHLDAVAELLGRPYSVAGSVLRGDQLGQQIGFPTANLDVSELRLPPAGVYAGIAEVAGTAHLAAANIGCRPTLGRAEPDVRLEVHLLDFKGDLYGREVEFAFRKWLRAEQKFSSLEALKEQIGQDVDAVRALGR